MNTHILLPLFLASLVPTYIHNACDPASHPILYRLPTNSSVTDFKCLLLAGAWLWRVFCLCRAGSYHRRHARVLPLLRAPPPPRGAPSRGAHVLARSHRRRLSRRPNTARDMLSLLPSLISPPHSLIRNSTSHCGVAYTLPTPTRDRYSNRPSSFPPEREHTPTFARDRARSTVPRQPICTPKA